MDETRILLDEARFATLDESGKPAFIFDWLQRLNKILTNLTSSLQSAKPNLSHKETETNINNKGDYRCRPIFNCSSNQSSRIYLKELVRNSQKKLVAQLSNLIQTGAATGPIIRQLVSDCFVSLFIVGDTFLLFETINKCVYQIKAKKLICMILTYFDITFRNCILDATTYSKPEMTP